MKFKNYNFIQQEYSAKCLTHISRKDAFEFLQISKNE